MSKAYSKSKKHDNFIYLGDLEIITIQLKQMVTNKNRYSPATINLAFIWYLVTIMFQYYTRFSLFFRAIGRSVFQKRL